TISTDHLTLHDALPISSDVDSDPLTFIVVTQPQHGSLSGAAPNVTYTPAPNYNGPDSFTFGVNDGQANSSAATVSITVTPVNDRSEEHTYELQSHSNLV